jgi:hypothetical protein
MVAVTALVMLQSGIAQVHTHRNGSYYDHKDHFHFVGTALHHQTCPSTISPPGGDSFVPFRFDFPASPHLTYLTFAHRILFLVPPQTAAFSLFPGRAPPA